MSGCLDSISEASLIVPDFTISVYGSSCNYLFFCLILASLLSFSIYWHPQCVKGCQKVSTIERERRKERMRTKGENYSIWCIHNIRDCTDSPLLSERNSEKLERMQIIFIELSMINKDLFVKSGFRRHFRVKRWLQMI